MRRADRRTELLLQVLEGAFTAKGWQGTTLSGALRGLGPREALWRPRPGRHNVWELVLHAAFWKHIVRLRVEGRPGSEAFPRPGRNFPKLPEQADAASWQADVALLKREHELLRRTVRSLPPSRLGARVGRSRWTVAEVLFGVAAHDLYHTGQIQLLKALRRAAR